MKDPFHFLKVPRTEPPVITPATRVRRFAEINRPFKTEAAALQADRCLACGNPYCEWKCPSITIFPTG